MAQRWFDEVEERARQALPVPVFRYLLQGARRGVTAAEATHAWRDTRLMPRVLRDVTDLDLSVRLLGTDFAVPFGIAPTTHQRAVHPDGELAMARAAASAGAPLVVSSNAGTAFEEIGAVGTPWWVQAYLPADRGLAVPMLSRAVEAGASAVVLTVDTPVVSTKYDGPGPTVWDLVEPTALRVNFDAGYDAQPGAEKALDLGPHDIGWLAEATGLPVVVKGVLHPDDARRCAQAGAAAVWVSNHGGRQFDRAISTAAALPEIVDAIGTTTQVYVDGGVRDGSDVHIALALGADAVFLGRLPLLSLAADGAEGVRRTLTELRTELEENLRLSGCRTVADAHTLRGGPARTGSDLQEP